MKRALVAILFGCLAMGLSSTAFAGNNIQAGISLHVGPYTQKNICTTLPVLTSATMVTEVACTPGTLYSVYLLVCNGSDRAVPPELPSTKRTGVAGFQCGIQYNGFPLAGVDVSGWVRCSTLDFPQPGWPAAGTGNTITWDRVNACQDDNSEPFVPGTVIAIGGVFQVEVYGPDQMAVVNRPVDNIAKVADCNAVEDIVSSPPRSPSQLGIAGFCLPGYNPCGLPTPVESSTWGAIKKAYD